MRREQEENEQEGKIVASGPNISDFVLKFLVLWSYRHVVLKTIHSGGSGHIKHCGSNSGWKEPPSSLSFLFLAFFLFELTVRGLQAPQAQFCWSNVQLEPITIPWNIFVKDHCPNYDYVPHYPSMRRFVTDRQNRIVGVRSPAAFRMVCPMMLIETPGLQNFYIFIFLGNGSEDSVEANLSWIFVRGSALNNAKVEKLRSARGDSSQPITKCPPSSSSMSRVSPVSPTWTATMERPHFPRRTGHHPEH